ncbi:CD99 molecule isoform X1 [Thunnus maccoyii]|uniref:CD99 molecule isoform X1 n=1 Tax=Thunnus maccoyii TaxID=8240 RepID=UPI001C4ADDAE|nr:CD99 molecule isoform X1 [Thunnus maccoyii]
MESCLRIVLLLFLVSGTLTQEGFDLADALGGPDPTPAPKAPEKPKIEEPVKPKKPSGDDFGLDLEDALKPDKPEPEKPKKPTSGGGGGDFDLDLEDALKPDKPEPAKPKKPTSGGGGGDFDLDLEDALKPDPITTRPPDKPVKPNAGGGGGSFDDSDLFDVSGGDYKPDGGRHKPDGGSGHDTQSDADQPQGAGSGQIAGIASAIGVALLGAASSYFAYQKKKLCFKLQGGADPESGKGQHGTQSEPQVLSNLLRTS